MLKETVRLLSTVDEDKAEEFYWFPGEKLGGNFSRTLLKVNVLPENSVDGLRILAFKNDVGYFEFLLKNGSRLMKVKFKGETPMQPMLLH